MAWLFLSFPWRLNIKFIKVLFSMVMFYFLCLYRSSGHIVGTISQLKKTCSSFLILWGKMTLTLLLMLRYISYKSFIIYFSLYSSVHRISCRILCIVTFFVFLLQKMDSILMVRSKDWRNRGKITLEWQRERSVLV